MIVGTAGHIDHGKTTLVRALSGVDTDRLKEEKARGISIELGYAYVPLNDGGVLGFIDVPGHEKLVHTMAAGACGIDFALLVIAADDGVMPQTREHLAILELLGVTRGAVAVTKCDRAEASRVRDVHAQIEALLADGPLRAAPLFDTDATKADDEGVVALSAYLRDAAAHWRTRRDDEQGEVDAAGARNHRVDQPFVARHVDETEHIVAGQPFVADCGGFDRNVCVAKLDRNSARLLFLQAVGIDAGQRPHQRRLAVIDMPRGADDHG